MEALVFVILALALIGVLTWLAYKAKFEPKKESEEDEYEGETVKIETSDGVLLSADFMDAPSAKYAVILLHMMPSDKTSFRNFSKKLKDNNFASLAIDLRGHGYSEGGPKSYRNFGDEEHQKSILDVKAASHYLSEKGYEKKRQLLVGASIGANLALQFMSQEPLVKAAALLSPGLNYHGLRAMPLIHRLHPGQFVLMVSSEDDERNALEAKSMVLEMPKSVGHRTLIYGRAGHGTKMFDSKEKPSLEKEIIETFRSVTGMPEVRQ